MGAARSFVYPWTSHGSGEVTGDEVVEKNEHRFEEREENGIDKVSRVRKRGVNDMKPEEGVDKGNGSQDKVSESMNLKNTAEEGTVKVKENSEGKEKLAQKEDTTVAIEKIVAEKENNAKLDDGAVEKIKREKIYEEGENDEIKQVKGKSEVSNKDGEMGKEEAKQNDKRKMVKAEIGNDIVEKDLLEQSIGEANMAAIENVNKKEVPEKSPVDKVETEQAEGDNAIVEVEKSEKGKKSGRMVNRANGAELAAGEEINTNVYDNEEQVAEENSSRRSRFSRFMQRMCCCGSER